MKKSIWMITGMLIAATALAQHNHEEEACDCPSCQNTEKTFNLPGVGSLNAPEEPHTDAHADCEGHDHEEHDQDALEQEAEDTHAGHDHAAHEDHDEHEAETAENHEGQDHASHTVEDEHAGHDHAGHADEGLEVSSDAIRVAPAEGGVVNRVSTFPAEIKLNRDRTASVSPRYASIVRQVFAEIGDEVRKGDVLASLENRETLAVYTVASPLDGVIISKNLAVGESKDAGSVLYEVTDLHTVWADISVFPQYQHLIKKDMPVTFIAHDGHTTQGRVKYISPIVSHETRTFTARVVLEGAEEDFTPGAFVRAQIAVETADVPVRVPLEAVQQFEGESVVFLPKDGSYITQPVRPGLADDHFVEIRHGLESGQAYVQEGAFQLKAEMITSGMDPHAGHGH